MLEIFGKDLALGYDIGCRFQSTLKKSPLGKKANENNHTSLVGAFHGHAHNRLCQLRFLATYVDGLGLEDLEGCERFFLEVKCPCQIYSVRQHLSSPSVNCGVL